MNLHASVNGFTAWEVLDSEGNSVQSGARHNLITDAGLDALATETGEPFKTFRTALQVGTGSGTPTNTKTSLTNKVAAQNSNGGFTAEETTSYSIVNGVLTGSYKIVRIVDFTAAYNLTEYGLSASTTGTLTITELFRDAGGNPVAVTVQNGYQLKLTHTLNIGLPYAATAAVLNLGSNVNVNQTFYANGASYYSNCFQVFAPGSTVTLYLINGADAGNPTVQPTFTAVANTSSVAAYVAGSFQRTKTNVVDPANGNSTVYGYMFTIGANTPGGFKCSFQGGATVTKTSAQRLTLNFTVSWGRG